MPTAEMVEAERAAEAAAAAMQVVDREVAGSRVATAMPVAQVAVQVVREGWVVLPVVGVRVRALTV